MRTARPQSLIVALMLGASGALAVDLRSPGIAPRALQARLDAPGAPLVVDVRSPTEYSAGHVPGAVNIPAPTVTRHLAEIRQAGELVLYCNDRRFTAVAERLLTKARVTGYSHLQGGLSAWREQGLPLQTALPE